MQQNPSTFSQIALITRLIGSREARGAAAIPTIDTVEAGMSEDPRNQDLMGYERMAQDALRGVVREALRRAASPQGLPGAHHFYVSFATQASDVVVPPELIERYPEEMTIVIQHQFWDLLVDQDRFSVVLKFGGQPRKLVVPYGAITRFHDPTVPFGLQFDIAPPVDDPHRPRDEPSDKPQAEGAPPDGPKIVSLDHFRKK